MGHHHGYGTLATEPTALTKTPHTPTHYGIYMDFNTLPMWVEVDSEEKTGYITVNAVYTVASFTTNITSGAIPLTVQFNDTSPTCPTEWFWDFGDGTNSTSKNPIHTYENWGKIHSRLHRYKRSWKQHQKHKQTYHSLMQHLLQISQPHPPMGSASLTVTFTDTSSNIPTSWLWIFGDGTTSTSQNPSHNYSTSELIPWKLTATTPPGTTPPQNRLHHNFNKNRTCMDC
jgi:PKD repeat protein